MHPLNMSNDRAMALALLLIVSGCATAPAPVPPAALPAATVPGAANAEKAPPDLPDGVPVHEDPVSTAALPEKPDVCRQPRTCTTFDEYAEYLRTCPSTPDRQELLAALARLLAKQKSSDHAYMEFTQEFPDGLQFIPPIRRLALVGPDGLRVHDCIEHLQNGMETSELLLKIQGKNGRYKDFSLEEIEVLKQMGLTTSIIQAMIESTIEAEREAERLRRKGAPGGAAAGSRAVQDGPYTGSAGQEQQIEAPLPAAGAAVPPVQDSMVNCAAQTAALEACKQLSGFAQSLCTATVKARFPGQ